MSSPGNPLLAYWNEEHLFWHWGDWNMDGSNTWVLYRLKDTDRWVPVSCVIHAKPTLWQTSNWPQCHWRGQEHWTRVDHKVIAEHDEHLARWRPYLLGEVHDDCRHVSLEVINNEVVIGGQKVCSARGMPLFSPLGF